MAFASLLPLHLFTLLDLSVIEPHDFWWHVRTGQIIGQTGSIPTTDAFSFVTNGARFVNEPWLAQLILYEVFSNLGLAAVILLHALTISLGYALVWRVARVSEDGVPLRTSNVMLASVIAAAVGAGHFGVRPQSFSLLLFGALVWAMAAQSRGRGKALYWSAPIFALWTNLHGGFAFGLLALAIHCAARLRALYTLRDRRAMMHTAAGGLVGVVACGCNPAGFSGVYEHVAMFFRAGGTGVLANAEFVPISIKTAHGLVFFVACARLLVACVRGKHMPPFAQALPLGVFGVLAIASVRFEPYFGFLLLLPLANAMEAESNARKEPIAPKRSVTHAAIVVASIVLAIATLPFWRSKLPLPASRGGLLSAETPILATLALCDGSHERVFADQGFASYLIYACPSDQVFLDTRVQLYDARAWEEYDAVVGGRFDAPAILDAYKVDHVMMRLDQRDGERALRASGAWTMTYSDDLATVWSRVNSRSAP